ncbi:MAG: tetratricopeptide repeat protein [Candidatus Latescibacteria bacterium]|nr:tetratricopeptide repeat protein [Candidatus Latescibacterota bacterium]
MLLLDSEFYDRQARSLLAGAGWTEGVFFMNPFYPYFLALVYWIGGTSWGLVAAVQIGLGTATCWLTYTLGEQLWGRRVGLIGAALVAVHGVLVFYDNALLTATPILFLNLAGMNLLQRWRCAPAPLWLCLAGVCLGFSALARPLVLVWVLLLGGWFAARRQWVAWGYLALGCVLVLAPVMIRNWAVGGEFALTTSSAGMNFYIGNHPQATGIYAGVDFVPSAEPDQEREGFVREAERRLGRPLGPGAASAFWLGEGFRFVWSEPAAYAYLLWRKFLLFWNEVESQNNLSFYFAREWVPLLYLLPGWGVLAPLGLAGWAIWARRRREVLLELYVLAYLVGCLVFFVSSEYRLPVVPVLALWAGLGFAEAQAAWRAGRFRTLGAAAGALLALGAVVHYTDPLVARLHSMRIDFHNFAVLYERQGNLERAREMARRCLAIDPGFGPAQQTLARLEARQVHPETAEPDTAAARGLRLFGAGDFARAATVFAELAVRSPEQGRYHNSLGLCYYKMGEMARAEAAYLRAIELNPAHAAAHYNLGLLRLAQGAPDLAIQSLRRALNLDPQYRAARFRLGEVLARQGDRVGGLAAWDSLLAQVPGDRILAAKLDSLREAIAGGGR